MKTERVSTELDEPDEKKIISNFSFRSLALAWKLRNIL